MEEKKECIRILCEISKILKEKYNLQDEEISEYINEYGLLELYNFCPDEVSCFSYDILAKDIYESVTAEKYLESQYRLVLQEKK